MFLTVSAIGTIAQLQSKEARLTNKGNRVTQQEQMLADDKMRAEIARLVAETAEIQQNMKYRFWVMGAAYVGALGVIVKLL